MNTVESSATAALTTTLPDGRVFPTFNGEALSWPPGSYDTLAEEQSGYPRSRAVIRAMREHRELVKGSSGMFSGNAARALMLLEEECPELRSV